MGAGHATARRPISGC